MRLKGHKLTIEGSGETLRAERSSTGYCICGWTESHSTKAGVHQEYHWHLDSERKRLTESKNENHQ